MVPPSGTEAKVSTVAEPENAPNVIGAARAVPPADKSKSAEQTNCLRIDDSIVSSSDVVHSKMKHSTTQKKGNRHATNWNVSRANLIRQRAVRRERRCVKFFDDRAAMNTNLTCIL